jgi:hypothetical protein
MMNVRGVKIFGSASMQGLEDKINKWLEDTGNTVESIAYNASGVKYSALVYYTIADEHRTEPLAE